MVTETPPPDPDFDARFELPGTVQTNEEFSITLVIENNGGAGEFRSEVSYRYNQAEWQTYDEHLIEFVEAESTERIEGDQTSLSYPGTYQFRLEATDQTSTVSVERPQEYQPDYARANAKSPSYDTLFRQFETYQGQPIHFLYASVYQVIYDWDEERDLDYMQMSVTNNEQGY